MNYGFSCCLASLKLTNFLRSYEGTSVFLPFFPSKTGILSFARWWPSFLACCTGWGGSLCQMWLHLVDLQARKSNNVVGSSGKIWFWQRGICCILLKKGIHIFLLYSSKERSVPSPTIEKTLFTWETCCFAVFPSFLPPLGERSQSRNEHRVLEASSPYVTAFSKALLLES